MPRVKQPEPPSPDSVADMARAAMSACHCMRVRTAARRLVQFYEAKLSKHGFGIAQFGLMGTIAALERGTISELAAELELDPSTLSRTLRPLEDEGLIEIAPDPDNLRVRRVKLTEAGRARLSAASDAWREAQNEAAAKVPEALVAELLRATDNLS